MSAPSRTFPPPERKRPATLKLYFREMGGFALLTREEEARLAGAARKGCRSSMNQLVEANLKWVVVVAKEFTPSPVPLEDLINAGNLGLLAAARRFDPGRGTRFCTYAVWWIRKAIGGALLRRGVVTITGYRQRKLRHEAPIHEFSLDSPVGENGALSWAELLADTLSPSAESAVIEADARARLDTALATLDDREALVIRHRFGLDDTEVRTFQDIGKTLGISRERVRQIESEALGKMRRVFAGRTRLSDRARASSGSTGSTVRRWRRS